MEGKENKMEDRRDSKKRGSRRKKGIGKGQQNKAGKAMVEVG